VAREKGERGFPSSPEQRNPSQTAGEEGTSPSLLSGDAESGEGGFPCFLSGREGSRRSRKLSGPAGTFRKAPRASTRRRDDSGRGKPARLRQRASCLPLRSKGRRKRARLFNNLLSPSPYKRGVSAESGDSTGAEKPAKAYSLAARGLEENLKKTKAPTHLSALLGGLFLFTLTSLPAWAAGLACRQDCSQGSCSQATCDKVKAGQPNGFCRCSSASETWDGTTYSSWCGAWGQPQPACAPQAAVRDERGRPLAQAPVQLENAQALAQALRSRNPYVATLVSAVQNLSNWAEGPVEGLIHDSYYDTAHGVLTHSVALPFTGRVVTSGLGTARIEITVKGDMRQLAHLKAYCDSATPSSVPPQLVQGTVTDGGLHGSLQVIAPDGRSETLQW